MLWLLFVCGQLEGLHNHYIFPPLPLLIVKVDPYPHTPPPHTHTLRSVSSAVAYIVAPLWSSRAALQHVHDTAPNVRHKELGGIVRLLIAVLRSIILVEHRGVGRQRRNVSSMEAVEQQLIPLAIVVVVVVVVVRRGLPGRTAIASAATATTTATTTAAAFNVVPIDMRRPVV